MQICPSCFAQESDDAKFCGLCGKGLVGIKEASSSLVGVVLDGKYVIRELLARGGMGEVYLAEHTKLRQKVAVKILNRRYRGDRTVVKRFFNEAASYCRVSHPNAVKLHDFGKLEDDTLYMIMEFVPGETLTRHLARHGPLGNKRTLQLGMQLAEVLLAAHSEGVVHRDLKPDNLMLVEVSPGRHQLKVLDFGIAKLLDNTGGEQLTETNLIFGTPEFMSPEQAQGFDVDHRADIYAFGMLLYYMLTANLPFHGGAKLSILNRQVHETPKRPTELSPDLGIDPHLEAIALTCIEKARADRYDSFEIVLNDLEQVAAGKPPPVATAASAARGAVRHGGAPATDGETRVFDSAPLIRLSAGEQTVRAADPLQAMFDRAPTPNRNDAVTVVRDVHGAETRVARGSAAAPDTTRRVAHRLGAADHQLELGALDPALSGDSGPMSLGVQPAVGSSAPRILGKAPEMSATSPRMLGEALTIADSGPFIITPEPPEVVASSSEIPIILADASRPGRPVDEDVITGEQPIVSVHPSDDDLTLADDGPPNHLSLSEAARREPEGQFMLSGPDDDDDNGGFVLGDSELLDDDALDHSDVRPYERRGSGAIIGLVLLLLAVGGTAVWYFVLREPARGTAETSTPAPGTSETDTPPGDDEAGVASDGAAPIDEPTDTEPDPLAPLPAPAALGHEVRALATVRLLEQTAEQRIDEGQFDDAEDLLKHVQKHHKDDLDDLHATEVGALVVRLDSASELFKDGSKEARRQRCSRAEEALTSLEPLSSGAAASLRDAIDKCKRKLAAPPSRVE